MGEGSKGERVGVLVAILAGNFKDYKLWSSFSRLLDDYLGLHLFGPTTLMAGSLTRAREPTKRGQWRVSSEFGDLTLLALCHDGRVLAKVSLNQSKRVSLE